MGSATHDANDATRVPEAQEASDMSEASGATGKTGAADEPVGIVFTDVDGTLVGADHHPILSTEPVMRRVGARVPVCLVSARSPEGLYSIQDALGFSGPMACFSGAYVLDEKGDVLLSKTFPTVDALEAKEYLARELPGLAVGTYGFHDWIVDDRSDPLVAREEAAVQTCARECSDIEGTFGERGVHKLLIMGERDSILEAERVLSARYPHLNVVRSSPILCEVMVRGVSKSEAVRVICEHCGVDPRRAIAFGDGPNDIDMLRAVRRSFAMANGEEHVKEAASEVVPWTNEEGGVARMLERLVLGS